MYSIVLDIYIYTALENNAILKLKLNLYKMSDIKIQLGTKTSIPLNYFFNHTVSFYFIIWSHLFWGISLNYNYSILTFDCKASLLWGQGLLKFTVQKQWMTSSLEVLSLMFHGGGYAQLCGGQWVFGAALCLEFNVHY